MFPQDTVVRYVRSKIAVVRTMNPTLMGPPMMAQSLRISVAVTVCIVFQRVRAVNSNGEVVIEGGCPTTDDDSEMNSNSEAKSGQLSVHVSMYPEASRKYRLATNLP